MALAAGLTDIDQIVIRIAHDANCGAACERNHPHLARRKTQRCIFALFRHQLRAVSCGTGHLAASAGIQLHIMHHGTYRDLGKRQTVAHSHFGFGPVHDLHSIGQALGSEDIGLLAVLIADQRDIS